MQNNSEKVIKFSKNSMSVIKDLFLEFNMAFLIKSYIIGCILFYFSYIKSETFELPLALINLILFPFANLVWNGIYNTLFGGVRFVINIFVLIILVIVKYIFIYTSAVLIAPIGIIYLYFCSKNRKQI